MRNLPELNIVHPLSDFLVHSLPMDIYILETVQLANQSSEYPIYGWVSNVYMPMHLETNAFPMCCSISVLLPNVRP